MDELTVIAPGVFRHKDNVLLCPGCGLEGLPTPLEPTPANVLDWCLATFQALYDSGLKDCDLVAAVDFANRYLAKPWHLQAHDGYRAEEGYCDE